MLNSDMILIKQICFFLSFIIALVALLSWKYNTTSRSIIAAFKSASSAVILFIAIIFGKDNNNH
jgi:hypothetical protein